MSSVGPNLAIDTVARSGVSTLSSSIAVQSSSISTNSANISTNTSSISTLVPGGTTGWEDSTAGISVAGIPGSFPPTAELFGGSSLRKEYSFAVGDYVFLEAFHTKHDVKPGGHWYVHVHWTTNGTNVQPVKWEFQIQRALGHNQANFAAPVSYFVTQTPHGTAWRHMVAEVADGDRLTVLEPDELILVTLRRVTNGATENTDQVFALTVDFHYQTDRDSTPNKAPNFYT